MKHAILAIMILIAVSLAAAQPCEDPPGQPTDVQIPPTQSCGVFMVWRSPPGATYIQSYRGATPCSRMRSPPGARTRRFS